MEETCQVIDYQVIDYSIERPILTENKENGKLETKTKPQTSTPSKKTEYKSPRHIRIRGHFITFFATTGPELCGTCRKAISASTLLCKLLCCEKMQCFNCTMNRNTVLCRKTLHLKEHYPTGSSIKSRTKGAQTCTVCWKKFISKRSMKRHLRFHLMQEQKRFHEHNSTSK